MKKFSEFFLFPLLTVFRVKVIEQRLIGYWVTTEVCINFFIRGCIRN